MIQTVEQLAETVKALPQSDRDRFFDLIETVGTNLVENNGGDRSAAEQAERFQLSMKWLHDHKQEYDGKWVCLDGERLIASGDDGLAVFNEAKAKGVKVPFLERVKANELPFGGW